MNYSKFPDLVLNPDRFFSRSAEEGASLAIPVVIVGMIGAANIGTSILTGSFGYNQSLKALLFSGSPFIILALPVGLWILVSGILFLLGKRMSGKGDFVTTLSNSGYSFLPVMVFSILFHTAMLTVMPALVNHFQEGMLFFLVMFLVFMTCLFWTCYILVFGVKHAHSLDNGQAFNAVVIMSVLLVIILAGAELALMEYHGLTTEGMP